MGTEPFDTRPAGGGAAGGIRIDHGKVLIGLLAVIALILVGVVLRATQVVLLPLIIAWLLSYILGPIVTFLTRRRVPVALSISFVLVLLLGIGYFVGLFLHSRVMNFALRYDIYYARLIELIRTVTARWDLEFDVVGGFDLGPVAGEYVRKLAQPVVAFGGRLLLVVIFLVFLLLGKPYFPAKIERAFSPEDAAHITHILGSISSQIGRFLVMQLLISLATGLCVWLALMLIGVDFPITWGATAFLLNFIPTLGSIVASIPPVLLAVVQFPTLWPAVVTLVSLFTIQMTIGNFIAPKILGDRLNLSPVVVLISLVFWGWLWGITGAILAVPIASTIKIVCENFEGLKPISMMMGSGRSLGTAKS